MARVIVVGGGVAGLTTALLGARRGHEMVLVERGAPPPDGDAEALAGWDRSGVVQAPFAHAFKARSTRVLREEAPDVLDAMRDAGVSASAINAGPGYDDDELLEARRHVYEGMLRRAVDREPGVSVVRGSVRGLVADGSRVTGVRVATGPTRTGDRTTGAEVARGETADHRRDVDELRGDIVVDAGGRRSASSRWLQELGLPTVHEEHYPADQHYLTRHYRLRPGHERPGPAPVGMPLPYAFVIVFGGDNATFSVAGSFGKWDPLLGRLHDPEVFDRFLQELPLTAPWLEHADPIGPVHVMAGLANRRRVLVTGVQGLALVGDSSLYTNPARGHGVSLSLWMAQHLAECLDRWADHPDEAAAQQAWIDRTLRPFFDEQVAFDHATREQFRAGIDGVGFLPPAPTRRPDLARMVLAQQDPQVAQLVNRVNHLLAPPSILAEPDLMRRVEELLATDPALVPSTVPLTRERFEALVA